MEFTKIKLTKQGTLNATYKNDDGDVIDFTGANIVHKDLKQAMQAITPHLALITEQREAHGFMLEELREQRITDEKDNIYKRLNVDSIAFSSGESKVSISGTRILTKTGVVMLTTPMVNLEDSEDYDYADELSLDVDAVKYEAKAYIEERKWGVKEAGLEFKDIEPFAGGVKADEAPTSDAAPKKRGRKPKKVA